MTRLALYEPKGVDLIRRYSFRTARKDYGGTFEPLRVIAHHKALMTGYGMFAMAAERYAKSVDQRLKSLAMLRAAQLIGCEWCLDFGSHLAVEGGVPEADLRELSLWRSSERFDGIDRLVLEYAEGVTRTPVAVSDELFAQLREHFDERQMVELTMAIAAENLHARINWAFGIEGEGYSEGSYCVKPDTAIASVPVEAR
jgi:AhpD family alkylhydroperoxidase